MAHNVYISTLHHLCFMPFYESISVDLCWAIYSTKKCTSTCSQKTSHLPSEYGRKIMSIKKFPFMKLPYRSLIGIEECKTVNR